MSNSFSIHHDLMIVVPVEKVYNAITLPEHLNNWWTLQCTGEPTTGATYNLFFSEDYNWFAEVTIADKPYHFELKMTKADEDWNPTTFGFRLQEVEDRTLLQFYHINWPECNHHFRRSSFCWAMLLNGLKNYLEKEIIIPFNERE
ncbi:Activator of Hsp90 ATPase homolog 1-like protein [Pustulibacterium marinum]|uniref:Activator of Hsp90 ATPase homolog 1-like protein n=1 Tax=Pustulibacterium marinum TaxID=1224947 RepID=A0A1I7EXL9_9FLAO|nr:SRPBCC domain-containing protein [Pustulibacterium marinum]SFU28629.1 Activator of Hsp90 ATPase homolog 1-like protein [Pustulibacterium marinum]